jgi:hypothetical protein
MEAMSDFQASALLCDSELVPYDGVAIPVHMAAIAAAGVDIADCCEDFKSGSCLRLELCDTSREACLLLVDFAYGRAATSLQTSSVLRELARLEANYGFSGLLTWGRSPGANSQLPTPEIQHLARISSPAPQGAPFSTPEKKAGGSMEWTPARLGRWRSNLSSWTTSKGVRHDNDRSKPAHLDTEQWRSHLAERKKLANSIDKAVSAGRLVLAAKHLRNMETLLSKHQGG